MDAIRRVLALPLAAVGFAFAFAAAIPAAGADWVNECAATTGQTGSWSEGVAYDPATQTADICGEAVFTPKASSAGNFVTLKFTTTLYAEKKDDAPDADTQGAVRIGPKGGFQVWTLGNVTNVKMLPTTNTNCQLETGNTGNIKRWLDVAANGVTPVPGAEYGITFVFDYAGGKYSVSVKDAKGGWKSLKSAAGAQSFPIARPDAYMVKSVSIIGQTDLTSIEGSYTSGR